MKVKNAWLISLLISGSMAGSVGAQVDKEDPEFVKQSPTIGEMFPDLAIYGSDGKEFKTSQFRGNYTVVTFGCLTCPPFMRKVAGMEAVYRDYGPKGVRFYFTYKALAHPERNGIVQPLTQDERIHQAREAKKRLGNSTPFLVDAIDNRLKHALIDRNNVPIGEPTTYDNAEFIIDPKGTIVRKRTWSNPEQVRMDLEVLVGKVDRVTKPEDVILNEEKLPPETASKGVIDKLSRTGMVPLVAVPRIDAGGPPFFAKLRVEVDQTVLEKGEGKLYLGFHLDPFLGAHWNNLKKPLRFDFEFPEGVKFSTQSGESPLPNAATDIDPREFFVNVLGWPDNKTVRLTVTYTA
ncbi:MAG TPA: redoxin domain-containing protein, partial [Gemmata sp.]|nr:redoxin domain-containing protein [Gemmata sp.]